MEASRTLNDTHARPTHRGQRGVLLGRTARGERRTVAVWVLPARCGLKRKIHDDAGPTRGRATRTMPQMELRGTGSESSVAIPCERSPQASSVPSSGIRLRCRVMRATNRRRTGDGGQRSSRERSDRSGESCPARPRGREQSPGSWFFPIAPPSRLWLWACPADPHVLCRRRPGAGEPRRAATVRFHTMSARGGGSVTSRTISGFTEDGSIGTGYPALPLFFAVQMPWLPLSKQSMSASTARTGGQSSETQKLCPTGREKP